jgi:hypothetical protein
VACEHDPSSFLERVGHFVRAAHDRGIHTMPVVWDSCFSEAVPEYDTRENVWFPNPGVHRLEPGSWPLGDRYCQDLVQPLGPEPGLFAWDAMNEPLMTSWVMDETWTEPRAEPIALARVVVIWSSVAHYCEVLRRLDTAHPTTVGLHTPTLLPRCGD